MTEETDEGTPRQMLDIDQVLKLVPISVRTLARMEVRGTFPPGRMVAGRKLWFAEDVARWQRNLDIRLGRSRPVRAEVA
jgi:predicted DNA-binding transcriptional regulator AlpA